MTTAHGIVLILQEGPNKGQEVRVVETATGRIFTFLEVCDGGMFFQFLGPGAYNRLSREEEKFIKALRNLKISKDDQDEEVVVEGVPVFQ